MASRELERGASMQNQAKGIALTTLAIVKVQDDSDHISACLNAMGTLLAGAWELSQMAHRGNREEAKVAYSSFLRAHADAVIAQDL